MGLIFDCALFAKYQVSFCVDEYEQNVLCLLPIENWLLTRCPLSILRGVTHFYIQPVQNVFVQIPFRLQGTIMVFDQIGE